MEEVILQAHIAGGEKGKMGLWKIGKMENCRFLLPLSL